uniref:Uncharacterized protein n=1 Tax=Parascaris univalens TaxID=6257 RepID=A0A915C3N3_PARUN
MKARLQQLKLTVWKVATYRFIFAFLLVEMENTTVSLLLDSLQASLHTELRSKPSILWVLVIFALLLLFILVIFVLCRLSARKTQQLCGYTLANYGPTSANPTDACYANKIYVHHEFMN